MQIDTKIDPRWCEALLGMLEGDLNHNRVAEVKRMLRVGIDSIRRIRPDAPGSLVGTLSSQDESIRGCLLSKKGRGDCEHFIGLPGKSIPGKHDGPDDTFDEYDRPNGWCEVCWRGRQIQFLEFALFESSKAYGGQAYAELAVKAAKSKAKIGILTKDDIEQLSPRAKGSYTVYVIEANKLSGSNGCPMYLRMRGSNSWTSDIDKAVQFRRKIDAEQCGGKNDGTWKIVEHGFCDLK